MIKMNGLCVEKLTGKAIFKAQVLMLNCVNFWLHLLYFFKSFLLIEILLISIFIMDHFCFKAVFKGAPVSLVEDRVWRFDR